MTFCASTADNTGTKEKDNKIIHEPDANDINKYEKFLVKTEQYTTKGADYHKKYYKYLINIADLIENEKKLTIGEESIGFYYDKRRDKKNELFLGIDIIATIDSTQYYSTYEGIALNYLRNYLPKILDVFNSYEKIFSEQEIVGSVISIKWKIDRAYEMVSIWLDQKDVNRFEKKDLTFDEMIQRSFITNTDDKIIKLIL